VSNTIYTITVVDDSDEELPPYQRMPGIFTTMDTAKRAVKNNEGDMSESGNNRYAVIEKTVLNLILPRPEFQSWFEWDSAEQEYFSIDVPRKFSKVVSFGIN